MEENGLSQFNCGSNEKLVSVHDAVLKSVKEALEIDKITYMDDRSRNKTLLNITTKEGDWFNIEIHHVR